MYSIIWTTCVQPLFTLYLLRIFRNSSYESFKNLNITACSRITEVQALKCSFSEIFKSFLYFRRKTIKHKILTSFGISSPRGRIYNILTLERKREKNESRRTNLRLSMRIQMWASSGIALRGTCSWISYKSCS